jgi:hypothetical protein
VPNRLRTQPQLTFAGHTATLYTEERHMKRKRPQPPPPVYVGDHSDKLSRLPAHRHDDDDDRPSREDRAPQGSQLFKSPVDLPRFLKRKRER